MQPTLFKLKRCEDSLQTIHFKAASLKYCILRSWEVYVRGLIVSIFSNRYTVPRNNLCYLSWSGKLPFIL